MALQKCDGLFSLSCFRVDASHPEFSGWVNLPLCG